jgi:hypothetical protein
LAELEQEIFETRNELEFCKMEVQNLTSERDKVSEMAESKCNEICSYLTKEFNFLEEVMTKQQQKQKAENSRFT